MVRARATRRTVERRAAQVRTAGADVVVFPELCLTGYAIDDLVLVPLAIRWPYLPRLVPFDRYSGRRVLEVGCGTGLLLFRVAPHTRAYHGTDFSGVALEHVRRHLRAAGGRERCQRLEQPELVGRPEAVLDRAQHPHPDVPDLLGEPRLVVGADGVVVGDGRAGRDHRVDAPVDPLYGPTYLPRKSVMNSLQLYEGLILHRHGEDRTTDSLEALASTRLESTWILRPSTRPARTHWVMVRMKNFSNASLPQRARALLKTLWSGIVSSNP